MRTDGSGVGDATLPRELVLTVMSVLPRACGIAVTFHLANLTTIPVTVFQSGHSFSQYFNGLVPETTRSKAFRMGI